jgi:hypothetical protein
VRPSQLRTFDFHSGRDLAYRKDREDVLWIACFRMAGRSDLKAKDNFGPNLVAELKLVIGIRASSALILS